MAIPATDASHNVLCLSLPNNFDARARVALSNVSSSLRVAADEVDPGQNSDNIIEITEERVVAVGADARSRKTPLLHDVPESILDVGSEEDFIKYSAEALRKLAKKEGLALGKAQPRERLVQELRSLFLSRTESSLSA